MRGAPLQLQRQARRSAIRWRHLPAKETEGRRGVVEAMPISFATIAETFGSSFTYVYHLEPVEGEEQTCLRLKKLTTSQCFQYYQGGSATKKGNLRSVGGGVICF